jgi:hypothetical protein
MPLPVILWGLDPLFLAFRKLLVASIFANVEKVIRGDDRYEFYLFDRPVQKIEIVGTIIGKVVRAKRVLLYVDDGTGVIECSKIYNAEGGEPTPLVEFRVRALPIFLGSFQYSSTSLFVYTTQPHFFPILEWGPCQYPRHARSCGRPSDLCDPHHVRGQGAECTE